MSRFVQLIHTIGARRKETFKQKAMLVEWQTKQLAAFIAATVPVAKGKGNPLSKQVDKLRVPLLGGDDEETEVDNTEETGADVSPENEFDYIEQGSKVAAARNAPGSFERLRSV